MKRHESATVNNPEESNDSIDKQEVQSDSEKQKTGHRILDVFSKIEADSLAVKSSEFSDTDGDSFSVSDYDPSYVRKAEKRLPDFESLLDKPEALKDISNSYLEQYKPNADTIGDHLYTKFMLDNYVLGQLRGKNSQEFYRSEEFRNYAEYIYDIARKKVAVLDNKRYYPDFATNPVLRDPRLRQAVLSRLGFRDGGKEVFETSNEAIQEYAEAMNGISGRLEKREKLSQGELDLAGDYLYSSRDFDNPIAYRFASYMFVDARKRQDLRPSVPMFGALANYFAHEDTLDPRLRETPTFIANYGRYVPKNKQYYKVNGGVSFENCCFLEQNMIRKINLHTDRGLEKSRFGTLGDLYSFMMASFHELTHNYQSLMLKDGKHNSAAMARILNLVLRRNESTCFTQVDHKLQPFRKTNYYDANHDNDEFEIQADEEAWRQCRLFIQKHEVKPFHRDSDAELRREGSDHYKKCIQRERDISARRAFCRKGDEHGNEMSYIEYDIGELIKSIRKKPQYLTEFPQLNDYFDQHGNIRPELFFQREVAGIRQNKTDNFGVEYATFAITNTSTTEQIIDYIKNNPISNDQALLCTTNLWNILHQCAIKMRTVRDVDYSTYDYTVARGKDISKASLRKSYLKQYLHQLYNCMRVSYMLKKRCPGAAKDIEHDENIYFGSYYGELSDGVSLEPEFTDRVKKAYTRSNQPLLQTVAKAMI